VSLMNLGDYVQAREHLEKLQENNLPKTDYVIYGLAALDCMTGHVEDSLRNLDEAIRLNPAVAFFRLGNDSDFQNLSEDPRFTELLYPDPGADAVSGTRHSRRRDLLGSSPWNRSSGRVRFRGKTLFRPHPLRVVAIGGGTGLSTLLKGLKTFVPTPGEPYQPTTGRPVISELSAIVTVQ